MNGYAKLSDFERYFESFGTRYYGDANGTIATNQFQDDVTSSFNKINSALSTIERIQVIPVGTMSNGSANPYLVEWNCCDVIYTKLRSRHVQEFEGKLPDWMEDFNHRGSQILDDIANERIIFDYEIAKMGIGYPQIVTHNGIAILYSNWDSGYYRGNDFSRTYHVKITGTTVGNLIGQAEFQVSLDDGYSYEQGTTFTTGTDWIEIENGLAIRFAPTVTTGTNKQIEYGDEWKIECIPVNTRSVSRQTKWRKFVRG